MSATIFSMELRTFLLSCSGINYRDNPGIKCDCWGLYPRLRGDDKGNIGLVNIS